MAPTALPSPARRRIFLYLGILIVLLAFGSPSGGLIDIPISFLLKNRLHLEAHEVADFRLMAAIPLYLAFVFGFIRDIWNPFGMRDRGFMLLFGGISAALYVFFAFIPMSYPDAAGRGHRVDGFVPVRLQRPERTDVDDRPATCDDRQISAVWNVFLSIPTVAALLVGGALSGLLEDKDSDQAVRILFLVGAAIMATVAAICAVAAARGVRQYPRRKRRRPCIR